MSHAGTVSRQTVTVAGVWTGKRGLDINPKADGPEKQAFIEHIECQPIDAQTNGPQLFYGLRYHTRIVKPDDVETFHDQVGYWLWEPATGNIIQTLTIPRGQTAMATGKATADATSFTLRAERGSTVNGISSKRTCNICCCVSLWPCTWTAACVVVCLSS